MPLVDPRIVNPNSTCMACHGANQNGFARVLAASQVEQHVRHTKHPPERLDGDVSALLARCPNLCFHQLVPLLAAFV